MDSLKKDLALIFGLFLLIIGLLIFGRSFTSVGLLGPVAPAEQSPILEGTIPVEVKTLLISAQVASSASDHRKGLSEKDSLPINEGMLFVFDQKGAYGFWMKDVKFAIDIIWIGEDKAIVDIAEGIAPEPGRRDEELTVFKPRAEARYVLEINAGLSKLHGLQIGDKVSF
ncbi:DUF192 domain-containing protein [Candidatus Curtissbacteria bacterium]|nr:DUF192 domain-containing protein [Candidatus Curtissbacteria bacterium]